MIVRFVVAPATYEEELNERTCRVPGVVVGSAQRLLVIF